MRDNDDSQQPPSVERPQPYPIDEALEAAYAPTFDLPPHSDDDDRQEQVREDAPASDPATSGDVKKPENGHADAAKCPNVDTGGNDLVCQTLPSAQSFARARGDGGMVKAGDLTLPETLAIRLKMLPSRWMVTFVLALMELGGEPALAASRCHVSLRSVRRTMAECPEFADACREAEEHTTGVMRAGIYQSATVGDLKAIYRGVYLVGFERVKNIKAAEMVLKLRGYLQDGPQQQARATEAHVADEALTGIVAAVTARLFAGQRGRPVVEIESEVVSESDKKA